MLEGRINFLEKLQNVLYDFWDYLIFGGYFNVVQNNGMDKSKNKTHKIKKIGYGVKQKSKNSKNLIVW